MINNVIQFPVTTDSGSGASKRKSGKTKPETLPGRPTFKPAHYGELLDINDMLTGGKAGLIAYEVTGYSGVPEIQVGYVVFADPDKKPRLEDTKIYERDGKTFVQKFTEEGFVVVGHIAVYDQLEKAKW
jgi:hypothetical protein